MTSVPAAIDGLLAALRSSPALSAARIEDGPYLDRPSEEDVVVVGWLPEEGPTVSWADPIAGLGSETESYDVEGLVSSWRGDTVMKAARDGANALLGSVRAAVKADPTLGGAVSRARLATASLTQYQTGQGCEVAINFVVHVDVF